VEVHVGVILYLINEAVAMHTNACRGPFCVAVELWSLMQNERG